VVEPAVASEDSTTWATEGAVAPSAGWLSASFVIGLSAVIVGLEDKVIVNSRVAS